MKRIKVLTVWALAVCSVIELAAPVYAETRTASGVAPGQISQDVDQLEANSVVVKPANPAATSVLDTQDSTGFSLLQVTPTAIYANVPIIQRPLKPMPVVPCPAPGIYGPYTALTNNGIVACPAPGGQFLWAAGTVPPGLREPFDAPAEPTSIDISVKQPAVINPLKPWHELGWWDFPLGFRYHPYWDIHFLPGAYFQNVNWRWVWWYDWNYSYPYWGNWWWGAGIWSNQFWWPGWGGWWRGWWKWREGFFLNAWQNMPAVPGVPVNTPLRVYMNAQLVDPTMIINPALDLDLDGQPDSSMKAILLANPGAAVLDADATIPDTVSLRAVIEFEENKIGPTTDAD